MGGTCNTHGLDEKRLRNTSGEETIWEVISR